MALPSILPRESFADQMELDVQFVQQFQQQRSATGGGNTGYADRAPSLWRAEATTAPFENAIANGFMALLNSRAGGLKTILLYDHKTPYPASDPDGSIIGAAVPTLGVIADRLHVAFVGFPPNYGLPLGTYFGVVFDTSRYYLGQLAEGRTANGAGAVASVEIWPPLPASVAAGAGVTVSKPPAKFRIIPGSAYPSSEGVLHSTIRFSAEQTYSR